MPRSLAQRHLVGEIMDDPALDPADHDRALRGLARLNTLSLAVGGVWRAVRPHLRNDRGPVHLLDVASGSGDIALGVARRAKAEGLDLRLSACDISPRAVERIRERAASKNIEANVFTADALNGKLETEADVVMSSLFLHHLTNDDGARLAATMAASARNAAVICDLRRTPFGLFLAWASSRLFTRSYVVHTDAVRSVRAAFTTEEARQLGRDAGLDEIALRSVWPQRFAIAWKGKA